MICTILSAITAIILSIYLYLTWNFDYWKRRGVNGPKPRPLFGNFPAVITRKRNLVYDFDDVYRKYKKSDKFVGVFITRIPEILILDPELAHEVLVTSFKAFHDNESSKWTEEPLAAGNPFVLTGQEWKDKRSEIIPALTSAKMKVMYPVLKQICSKLSNFLKDCSNREGGKSERVDAMELSMKFTAEVAADLVWGIEAGALSHSPNNVFISKSNQLIATVFDRIASYFLGSLSPFLWRVKNFRFSEDPSVEFFKKLLKDAMALRRESRTDRSDILNFLIDLQERKNLSHLELVTHTTTVLFDAFETSAALIAHCLLCIGRHGDVQTRLREEIAENVEEDGFLSFECLNELVFLDQVVNETLRMFPPLNFKSKLCTQPFDLATPNGGTVRIEVGQIVQIPTYSFHYDEDYFPQPERFTPERFGTATGGSQKPKDNNAFLPFGDGPRVCLGMKYALAQSKAAIVEVVRRFRIAVHESTRRDNRIDPASFITLLEGGIYLNFEAL